MCRHAAYVGPGIALTELMLDLDHCLRHQAYAARELLTGVVCADGYGITWYAPDVRSEPARYASVLPIWNDGNLRQFGPVVRSGTVMGAVRNATVEGSISVENCAPFVAGRLCLSLNGYLGGFDDAWAQHMEEAWLGNEARRAVLGTTDAEHILHMIAARMDVGLATAVQSTVRDLVDHAQNNGLEAQLNLLVSDGDQVVATRAGNLERQNSLYLLRDGDEFPGGQVVASEPLYDDPLWEPVDRDQVVVLRAGSPPVRLRV